VRPPLVLLNAWLTICSWWKVKPKGDADDQGGLVPAAYVESVSARQIATFIPRRTRVEH